MQPAFSAYPWPNGLGALLFSNEASAPEIALQRPDLEFASEKGFDSPRRRNGPRKSGVVWNFMQEGRAPQCAGIGQRLSALGGIENQLDLAVLDRIDAVRAAFQLFIDSCGMNTVPTQIPLGSRRCDDLAAVLGQQLDVHHNPFLPRVPH